MSTLILATKLYIPPRRPKVVLRPRLIERLNEGLRRKLTLISAPAGFGKATLLSAWVAGGARPAAWLSLDEWRTGNIPNAISAAFVLADIQMARGRLREALHIYQQSLQLTPAQGEKKEKHANRVAGIMPSGPIASENGPGAAH